MKLCIGNTWTNILNSLLHIECWQTSYTCCFLVTTENLTSGFFIFLFMVTSRGIRNNIYRKLIVRNSMFKHKKCRFLFISLPWLNELLRSINKLKQGLWCTIWLSYIYDNHINFRHIHFSSNGNLKAIFETTFWHVSFSSFILKSYNIYLQSLFTAKFYNFALETD